MGESPASSEAIGLEAAWGAVETAGAGVWRVLSLERLADDGWQVTALDRDGEVLVMVGRAPALTLARLARATRHSKVETID